MVVVRLIILIPVITRLDAIEVPRFARAILVVPPVCLGCIKGEERTIINFLKSTID